MAARKPVRLLALSVALAASGGSAWANTDSWATGTSGNFNDASNWNGGVPGTADTALFNTGSVGGYTVTLGSDVTNTSLDVENDNVTLDLGGYTYTNTYGSFNSVGMGVSGSGTLNLTNGTLVGYYVDVAYNAGNTSVINVGSGATLTSTWSMDVGFFGNGTINVSNGGVLSSTGGAGCEVGAFSGSSGTVTVDGAGSQWNNATLMQIGGGTGTLSITNGGVVNNTGQANIVDGGTVTVDGAGSQWSNGNTLYMYGGSLTVSNGGVVNNTQMYVGVSNDAATVTVTGMNSQLNSVQQYADDIIGFDHNGTLNIEAGATATGTYATIGYENGETGTVNVDGKGSSWTQNQISVGDDGVGILNVTNGGVVNSQYTFIGGASDGSGSVTVDGAGSQLNGVIYVGFGGPATLTISNGGVVAHQGYQIGSNSVGTVTVTGVGSAFYYSGPYNEVDGIGSGANGTLNIEAGATSSGDYGVDLGSSAGVTGTVNVDGAGSTLNISYFGIGDDGQGVVSITNGGVINGGQINIGNESDGTGSVSVDGAGSQLNGTSLYVGDGGPASLSVTNGAVVTITGGPSYIGGFNSGTSGSTATVDGTGSQWNTTGSLYVGLADNALLTISHDGSVSDTSAEIGDGSGITGTVSVQDAGSSWTTTGSVYVGGDSGAAAGTGLLNISNGTVTVTGTLKIYNTAGTSVNLSGGTLNVGTLNTSSTPSLFLGNGTTTGWTGGTLNITGSTLTLSSSGALGASLTLNSGMTLGTSGTGNITLGSSSTLTLSGGTLASTASLTSTSTSATINLTTGTFTRTASQSIAAKFTNQGIVAGPTTTGQTLTLSGAVSGTGSYTGNIAFTGSFSPGNSGPATISLANATFGSSDNLQMDLDGLSSMDHLNFSGTATLGGTFTLTLANGFVPAQGQSFDFFDGTTTGSFTTLSLPALTAGLAWNSSQFNSSGILTVGAINQWAAPVSGNYSDGTKWSNGSPPASSDPAIFNTGSTSGYTVTFTGAAAGDHIQVANDTVTFDLSGNTYTLSNTGTSTPSLMVGVGGTGVLTLKSTGAAGTLATGYVSIGQAVGDSGTVNLNDPNVAWTVSQTLSLGGSSTVTGGVGVLNMSGGSLTIAGTLRAWNTNSAINLSGGYLKVGTLTLSNPSELNWTAGTLEISNSNPTLSATGSLPANLTVSSNMALKVSGSSAIFSVNTGTGNTFTIDGGNVTTALGTSPAIEIATTSSVSSAIAVKDAGTVSSATVLIGYSGTGSVSVDGKGSQWNASQDVYDAYSGTGSLSITHGGYVSDIGTLLGDASGKTGTLTIDGADLTDPTTKSTLYSTGQSVVGYSGNGNLTISNGGILTNTDGFLGYIGASTPSSGTVTVSGAGSTWTCGTSGNLDVGYGGNGTLTIGTGGSVSDVTAYIGFTTTKSGSKTYYSSGTATINDAASSWTTSGSMYVGGSSTADAGSGALNINNGTVTVGGTLKIWKPANSSTTASVKLAGGTLNVGTLDTTSTPAEFNWTGGTLNVTNSDLHIGATGPLGASLSLASNMNLQVTGATHSLTLDSGSTLTNAGSVLAANMNITAGTYTSTGSTQIQTGTFTGANQNVGGAFLNQGSVAGPVTAGQSLAFTGNVTGTGSYAGNTTFAGTFAPTALTNTGTLQITGTGTTGNVAGTGTLIVNNAMQILAGTGLSQQGALSITGKLDITNNALAIAYAASGNPDPISSIVTSLQSAYDHGAWDGSGLTSSSAASTLGTTIGYADGSTDTGTTAATGTVLVRYTWLGDLNLDGTVTSSDLTTMTADSGMTNADWSQGDMNYDGTVNADDFALLALGATDSQGATIPVPEPTILGLLALPALGFRRRRLV
jgi:T5SS/PEP-CTERM-associated repeat protein